MDSEISYQATLVCKAAGFFVCSEKSNKTPANQRCLYRFFYPQEWTVSLSQYLSAMYSICYSFTKASNL